MLCLVACASHPAAKQSAPKTERPEQAQAAEIEAPAETDIVDDSTLNDIVQIRISINSENAIDNAARGAIERAEMPGSVIVVGGPEGLYFERAYGDLAVLPAREPMHENAIFDLASLTKVFTAAAVLRLVELGELTLETDVGEFFPAQRGRTLEDLLLHRSGLPAVDPLSHYGADRQANIDRIGSLSPAAPGRYLYSDLGFILLGEVVARVHGGGLPAAIEDLVAQPLGLHVRFFRNDDVGEFARAVPTEFAPRRAVGVDPPMIRGQVHDPRAYRLGGIAGHAGLFGTARDVASLVAQIVSGEQRSDWMSPALVDRWLRILRIESSANVGGQVRRALSLEAINDGVGHRGYTGTFFYADPETGRYVVALSSRVHPHGRGDAEPLRQTLVTVLDQLVVVGRPGTLQMGIDVLRADDFSDLAGQRIALFTHDPARARDGQTTRVLFEQASDAQILDLAVLFAPEHGFGANREGAIPHSESHGTQVYSLFGPDRDPPDSAFEQFDALVVDVQDVGVRFYTYLSSMHRLLRAAARHHTPVWILDRPNPLGMSVEGPLSSPAHRSFVNHHPLPIRHGLTAGEMAQLLKAEDELTLNLHVIQAQGWSGGLWDETGLRWVAPSPNLPTTVALGLYPGVALVEGANISVGRGTPSPFQLVGAPYVDARRLHDALQAAGINAEVRDFRPTSSRFRGQLCHGVFLAHSNDRAVHLGLSLLKALSVENLFNAESARALVADDNVFRDVISDMPTTDFQVEEALFRARSEPFWLYPRPSPR